MSEIKPIQPMIAGSVDHFGSKIESNQDFSINLSEQFNSKTFTDFPNPIAPPPHSGTFNASILSSTESIPVDIFFSIFKFLETKDLKMIAPVSTTWNRLSKDQQIAEVMQIDTYLNNQQEPIDLRLSDALLLHLVQSHGDKITCLNLGKRQITDTQLSELIKYCPNLKQLFINSDKISDQGLAHLTQLSALQSLNLSRCSQVTDAGLALMTQLSALLSLDLTYCNITDGGLAHLTQLSALQSLDLFNCFEITDAGLAHLTQLSALQLLNLTECNQITDAGLAHLSQLSALQSLNLSRCSQVTDAGLAHLTQLSALQSLNLSGCNITDDGLAHLTLLSALQSLNLSYCYEITDAGLAHLTQLIRLAVKLTAF